MNILIHGDIGYSAYSVALIIGYMIALAGIVISVGEYVPVVDIQKWYGLGNGLLVITNL